MLYGHDAVAIDHSVIAYHITAIPAGETECVRVGWPRKRACTPMLSTIRGVAPVPVRQYPPRLRICKPARGNSSAAADAREPIPCFAAIQGRVHPSLERAKNSIVRIGEGDKALMRILVVEHAPDRPGISAVRGFDEEDAFGRSVRARV